MVGSCLPGVGGCGASLGDGVGGSLGAYVILEPLLVRPLLYGGWVVLLFLCCPERDPWGSQCARLAFISAGPRHIPSCVLRLA